MFNIGDRVKFRKTSLMAGMIDAKESDVFTIKHQTRFVKNGDVWLEGVSGWWSVTHLEHVEEEAVNNTEEQEIKWEIGQEVFCILRGKGIVSGIDYTPQYPVIVEFNGSKEERDAYTIDGKLSFNHKNRSLFFSEPEIIAEKFPPKKPFLPVFRKGETAVAKKKDGQNTTVFYVDEETELSVASTVYNYPKATYNFYKLSEEIIFN